MTVRRTPGEDRELVKPTYSFDPPPPEVVTTSSDLYWAIYNAVIEELHTHLPERCWYSPRGLSLRHMIARNATQRVRDGEVHRDPHVRRKYERRG